jgi:LysR family nitrogen assimilation transcriptional regulator
VNELRTYVAEAATAPSGEVMLAAASSLRVLLTGPVVEEYCARYPGVSLTITEGMSRAMREAVAEGRADIGVFADAEPLDPLECIPLLTERLCVLGPVDAGLRMSTPVNADVLARHPLILTAAPNSLRTLVDRALRSAGYEYKSRLQVEMSSLILDLVQRGIGWSILPYCGVDHMLREGLVSAAPLRGVTFSWVVATSRERRVNQAVRLLADVIVAVARRAVLARRWKTARWDHDRVRSPRGRYRPNA